MNKNKLKLNRRKFIGITGSTTAFLGAGTFFGMPSLLADSTPKVPERPKTNFDSVKNAKRTKYSLPGLYPGVVTEVQDSKVWKDKDTISIEEVSKMMKAGIEGLTGVDEKEGWKKFVNSDDIVGIKVNPVGPKIIATTHEAVEVLINKLVEAGVKKNNIVIWDRFTYMLEEAGFTNERFPGVQIEGMQMMDTKGGDSWKDKNGEHVSKNNFDKDVYYWVDVEGPKDDEYLNMHVFNGKYSYFGKLVTQKLTKIINVPAMKNTGNGISMATKNLGYAAIANTNRLHRPLFFDVCTEVLGFPSVRDKLVLNILDGIRGQYEGGPMPNEKFVYKANKLLFATDPFAQDFVGYQEILRMRKADKNVKVNNSPRYTDYIRYAEKLGLGIADPNKIKHDIKKLA
jgi:hypothetical protein